MNRRRMMMEKRGKLVVFAEGSADFQNTAGEAEFNNHSAIKEGYIELEGQRYDGRSYFGKVKIPVKFSGYKTLNIEADAGTFVSAALGYGKSFDISETTPASIENHLEAYTGDVRKIYNFDISKVTGVQFICAGINGISSEGTSGTKIYNIWLE